MRVGRRESITGAPGGSGGYAVVIGNGQMVDLLATPGTTATIAGGGSLALTLSSQLGAINLAGGSSLTINGRGDLLYGGGAHRAATGCDWSGGVRCAASRLQRVPI